MAEVVEPIPAASVLLLRDDPLRVLMIRRHASSSFVPDSWVFPGGALEEEDRANSDGSIINAMRFAAARELYEETGIDLGGAPTLLSANAGRSAGAPLLDPEQLVWTAHWITPVGIPKRFDTYFFLACAPARHQTKLQASEAVDSTWISPADALRRHADGDFPLVFPTLKNLEAIVGFESSSALIDARRNAEIPTTRPILVVENGRKTIVLP